MASNNTKQSSDQDDLIKKHPQLREFKRKAKILYKQLQQEVSNEKISLSYCQDLVAKQHGYKHWHEFHANIKKEFSPHSAINFIGEKSLFKSNNDCYLGYSLEMKEDIWLSIKNKKNIVIGATPTLQKQLIVSLLKQQIKANHHAIYFHDMDQGSLKTIQKTLLETGRENDVYYISLDKNHPNSIETNYFLLDHFKIESSSMITELICQLVKYNEWHTQGRTISLLSVVLMLLTHLRDVYHIKLDIKQISRYLILENLLKELKNNSLPSHIHQAIKTYIVNLPNFNQETMTPSDYSLEFHGSLQMQINKAFGILEFEYLYLFKNERELEDLNIERKELIGLGKPKIFIIQHSSTIKNSEKNNKWPDTKKEDQRLMIKFWLCMIAGTYLNLMPYEFETVFDKKLKLSRENIVKNKNNSMLFLDLNNEMFFSNIYSVLRGFTQMKSWKTQTVIYGTNILEECKKYEPIEISEIPSLNIESRTYSLKSEGKIDHINIKHE